MKNLLNRMKQNAKDYKKHLDEQFFEELNFNSLINFCHPADREDFVREYREIKRREVRDEKP